VVGTRSTLVIVGAAAVVVMFVGIAASAPAEDRAGISLLGAWSAPGEAVADWAFLRDSWQEMVYADNRTNLFVSPDDGASWNSPTDLRGTFDVDGYVLYRANFSEEFPDLDAFFSRSFDNGTSWTSPTYIMTYDGGCDGAYRIFKLGPVLIFYIYVHAGGEGWINYSMSIDGGASWSPQAYIDDYVHTEDPIAADIVYCQGKLFLAYDHYETDPIEFYDVVVIESDDMGVTWTNRQVVGDGWGPMIKEDSGNLYVTYRSYTTHDRLMFTMSSDAGVTWTTPMEIGPFEWATDASNYHSLAVSGSQIFAGYMDCTPAYDRYTLHINYSADGGATWNDMGEVTGLGANACYPSLLISNGKLHLMFFDVGDPIGSSGMTYHRWLWLDEPIPEFGIMFVPILATMALVVLKSRKR
jgi:hypothetical protein